MVLMDVEMPEMGGFEATAVIRALPDPRQAKLPIVAMTAHALKGDRERCLAAGMDDYLCKPINAEDLTAMVERLAGDVAGAEAVATRPMPPGPAPAVLARPEAEDVPGEVAGESAVFDLDEAMRKCCGEYSMVQEMVGYLFDQTAPLLEQMWTALGSGNATELARTAHSLQSTVVYLGAHPAAAATRRVEQIGNSGCLAEAAAAIRQLEEQLALLQTAAAQHRGST